MTILGIDVGGTFTDAVLLDGDELRTAKVPTARRQEESVLAAAEAVVGARRRALHARDDDRDERSPRAARRADGARHNGGLRARPPSAPPGPRAPLPALRGASRAARAARALPRRARADRPGGRARAARPRRAPRSRRRGGDRRLPALLVPRSHPRAHGGRRAAPELPARARRLNDPYAGGTHLPDITLVSRTELGFAATRAHHADVGGPEPGSMPAGSRTLAEEGVVIPPTRLDEEALAALVAQMRNPDERRGDLRAQLAAQRLGARRVAELCARRGRDEVTAAMAELVAYSERRVRGDLRAAGRPLRGRRVARGGR